MDALLDRPRRPSDGVKAVPLVQLEAGMAGFRDGRSVGQRGGRAEWVTASTRMRPPRAGASEEDTVPMCQPMWPATTSCTAGLRSPKNGRQVSLGLGVPEPPPDLGSRDAASRQAIIGPRFRLNKLMELQPKQEIESRVH